jgi:hypothetical protein
MREVSEILRRHDLRVTGRGSNRRP